MHLLPLLRRNRGRVWRVAGGGWMIFYHLYTCEKDFGPAGPKTVSQVYTQ